MCLPSDGEWDVNFRTSIKAELSSERLRVILFLNLSASLENANIASDMSPNKFNSWKPICNLFEKRCTNVLLKYQSLNCHGEDFSRSQYVFYQCKKEIVYFPFFSVVYSRRTATKYSWLCFYWFTITLTKPLLEWYR